MKYYKVLNKKHQSCNGGKGTWKKGVWKHKLELPLNPCEHGYHLCRKKDIMKWLDEEIWIAEGRGHKIICDNKVVFQQARIIKKLDTWNDITARLFACDCAEHVLKNYEKEFPGDHRVRDCIEVARKYAFGKATEEELLAVRSAAESAVWSATWSAAWSAAESAVWSAAESAAWSAVRSAELAAGSAEKEWQIKQLFKYLDEKSLEPMPKTYRRI